MASEKISKTTVFGSLSVHDNLLYLKMFEFIALKQHRISKIDL